MARKFAGAGGMPVSVEVREVPLEQARAQAGMGEGGARAAHGAQGESGFEAHSEGGGRQPDFRVVQPEYLESEGKTIFKDVGALWKNISRKTGREFYTMKIGKLKLLVFPNQKLEASEETKANSD